MAYREKHCETSCAGGVTLRSDGKFDKIVAANLANQVLLSATLAATKRLRDKLLSWYVTQLRDKLHEKLPGVTAPQDFAGIVAHWTRLHGSLNTFLKIS